MSKNSEQKPEQDAIHFVRNYLSNKDTIYINNKPCDKFSMISINGETITVTKDTLLMFENGSIRVCAIKSYRLEPVTLFSSWLKEYKLYINDALYQTYEGLDECDEALSVIKSLDKIMKDIYDVVVYQFAEKKRRKSK